MGKGERVYRDSVLLICKICKWENLQDLNPSVWYIFRDFVRLGNLDQDMMGYQSKEDLL